MIYKDTLFHTILITAHSCIVEKELAVIHTAREWIGVEDIIISLIVCIYQTLNQRNY